MSIYGGWRTMWILAMFDLPTNTKVARRSYGEFRKSLVEDGFVMMQFSVYIRHCPSEENAIVHQNRIKASLPLNGEVRVLTITDKQFERMKVFHGKTTVQPEEPPEQIGFF